MSDLLKEFGAVAVVPDSEQAAAERMVRRHLTGDAAGVVLQALGLMFSPSVKVPPRVSSRVKKTKT